MKILYAARKGAGAHFQLNRFLAAAGTKHTIRTAAYRGQNYDHDIDWTLDALCDVFTGSPCTSGIAVEIYRDQVRTFAPDLVISDCEKITSRIANELGLKLWQVSPLLLLYAVVLDGRGVQLAKKYPTIFGQTHYGVSMDALVAKSDKVFVYSHFCDTGAKLRPECGWIRPYASVAAQSLLFEHDIVGVASNFHKPLLHRLKQHYDAVFFTEGTGETHSMNVKSMSSKEEYAGNVRNAQTLVVPGYTDLLADAFYNGRFANIIVDFAEPETIMNAIISERLGLGKAIYDIASDDVSGATERAIMTHNDGVTRMLDEEIEAR